MAYMMKKEHALWASVCLLVSVVPELLTALPEEADGHAETTVSERPPMKPKHTFCAMKMDDGCKATCIKGYKKKTVKTPSGAEKPDFCFLEEDPGICRSHITRYFYNNQSKQCEQFKYGGCLGNLNNFETLDACKSTCEDPVNELQTRDYTPDLNTVNTTLTPQSTKVPSNWEYHGPSWCLSPADSGLCQANEKRFYFNSAIGKCRQFKYTGCGGNSNNFTTKRECVRACKRGFIKRISKEGVIKIQRRKEPSVEVVYEAIN
nr:tissue factor pathway inhibitor [Peromyscus maniculatus bairdii]